MAKTREIFREVKYVLSLFSKWQWDLDASKNPPIQTRDRSLIQKILENLYKFV